MEVDILNVLLLKWSDCPKFTQPEEENNFVGIEKIVFSLNIFIPLFDQITRTHFSVHFDC
ncbi:hypothetical protein Mgra_00003072, partial [Meloidogyne graminicola]